MKPAFSSQQSEYDADIQYLSVGKKFKDDVGVEWEVVHNDEHWDEHRWYFIAFLAVRNVEDGSLSGHHYLTDKSEQQEGQFERLEYWFGEGDEFEWIPVNAKQTTTYEPA